MLASFFAGLALTLACVGLYGMMAYTVTRRTREIGIRVAIGARPSAVTWMVLRQTLVLVVAGAALGVAASVPTNRLIAGQLFDLMPSDPAALGAAIVLLFIVAAAAAYLPARRASRINPVIALRYE
ncbi:MAG: FtsX-like permease family protein [Vicinamibacterales bacterium]